MHFAEMYVWWWLWAVMMAKNIRIIIAMRSIKCDPEQHILARILRIDVVVASDTFHLRCVAMSVTHSIEHTYYRESQGGWDGGGRGANEKIKLDFYQCVPHILAPFAAEPRTERNLLWCRCVCVWCVSNCESVVPVCVHAMNDEIMVKVS